MTADSVKESNNWLSLPQNQLKHKAPIGICVAPSILREEITSDVGKSDRSKVQ